MWGFVSGFNLKVIKKAQHNFKARHRFAYSIFIILKLFIDFRFWDTQQTTYFFHPHISHMCSINIIFYFFVSLNTLQQTLISWPSLSYEKPVTQSSLETDFSHHFPLVIGNSSPNHSPLPPWEAPKTRRTVTKCKLNLLLPRYHYLWCTPSCPGDISRT